MVNIVKRSAEAVLAALVFVVAVPLIVLGAALSVICYRSSPFFVHERVGLHGRVFRLYKVRTLPRDTDPYADKFSIGQSSIPRVMQVMRRLHLDELPQLLHVVTGKMTFVGPRPEMPALHAPLPPAFATQRTSVRPGLTCLWQISPHSTGLIGERCEYDRLYVEHRNVRLDLWVLAKTARKMATGRTVNLHEVPSWAMGGPAPVVARGAAPAPVAIPASVSLVD